MKEILDVIHNTIYQFFDVCSDDEEVPISDKDKLLLEVNKAICNNLKALEQQSCEDCISRKSVDKIINKWLSHPDYELKDNIYDMTKMIHKLPSVTPKPCEYKPFTIDELKDEDMQKLLREFQNQKVLVPEHECLPSVTTIESCDDCISRQAVKEMLTEEWTKYMPMQLDINLSFVLEKISELPSVTPTSDAEDKYDIGYNCGYADAMSDIAESEG